MSSEAQKLFFMLPALCVLILILSLVSLLLGFGPDW